MTTTATYSFDPAIHEAIDEAAERAGLDPASLGGRHIASALRSLKFMLISEWATLGVRQWMVQQGTETMTVGKSSFNLPAGGIDLLDAVLRRGSIDTPMHIMARSDYLALVDKTLTGRPDRWFVDRQAANKVVKFWQCGENTTDVIVYDYFRQIQDPGQMSNTLQLPVYAQECMAAGLAARLAQKFNYPRFADLWLYYWGPDPNRPGGCLDRMRQEDRERGDIHLMARYEPRRGGR